MDKYTLYDDKGREIIVFKGDKIMLARYEDLSKIDREYWASVYCFIKSELTVENFKECLDFMNYRDNKETKFCS